MSKPATQKATKPAMQRSAVAVGDQLAVMPLAMLGSSAKIEGLMAMAAQSGEMASAEPRKKWASAVKRLV